MGWVRAWAAFAVQGHRCRGWTFCWRKSPGSRGARAPLPRLDILLAQKSGTFCFRKSPRVPARPGDDRLSRVLRRSTIGAEGFHGRVRDGIGCLPLAIATRPCRDPLVFAPAFASAKCRAAPAARLRSESGIVSELADELFLFCSRGASAPLAQLDTLLRKGPECLHAEMLVAASERAAPRWLRATIAIAIAPAIGRGIKRSIERLVPVSTHVAALIPPAYRRDGLSRLSKRPGFEGGFPLRCFQRLSCPDIATRLRGWRHDRFTRGPSTPVLSY